MSYYPYARTRGRGCRPKVNICMYRGYKGEGGLSVHILWMTSIISGFLNFIIDVFQACHIFYCRAKRKIFALCSLESKITIYNIYIYIYIYIYKHMQDHFLRVQRNLSDALAFCLYTARTF